MAYRQSNPFSRRTSSPFNRDKAPRQGVIGKMKAISRRSSSPLNAYGNKATFSGVATAEEAQGVQPLKAHEQYINIAGEGERPVWDVQSKVSEIVKGPQYQGTEEDLYYGSFERSLDDPRNFRGNQSGGWGNTRVKGWPTGADYNPWGYSHQNEDSPNIGTFNTDFQAQDLLGSYRGGRTGGGDSGPQPGRSYNYFDTVQPTRLNLSSNWGLAGNTGLYDRQNASGLGATDRELNEGFTNTYGNMIIGGNQRTPGEGGGGTWSAGPAGEGSFNPQWRKTRGSGGSPLTPKSSTFRGFKPNMANTEDRSPFYNPEGYLSPYDVATSGSNSTWGNRGRRTEYNIGNFQDAFLRYSNAENLKDPNDPANFTPAALEHTTTAMGMGQGNSMYDPTSEDNPFTNALTSSQFTTTGRGDNAKAWVHNPIDVGNRLVRSGDWTSDERNTYNQLLTNYGMAPDLAEEYYGWDGDKEQVDLNKPIQSGRVKTN